MGSGFAKKKKQAKAMQEEFAKMQEKLKSLEATGSAGNGLVQITLNGEHQITKVKIDPECIDPEDVEGLEDLIMSAHKEALDSVSEANNQQMGGLGGLGGLGMGF